MKGTMKPMTESDISRIVNNILAALQEPLNLSGFYAQFDEGGEREGTRLARVTYEAATGLKRLLRGHPVSESDLIKINEVQNTASRLVDHFWCQLQG